MATAEIHVFTPRAEAPILHPDAQPIYESIKKSGKSGFQAFQEARNKLVGVDKLDVAAFAFNSLATDARQIWVLGAGVNPASTRRETYGQQRQSWSEYSEREQQLLRRLWPSVQGLAHSLAGGGE